jgi:hypothetical protein
MIVPCSLGPAWLSFETCDSCFLFSSGLASCGAQCVVAFGVSNAAAHEIVGRPTSTSALEFKPPTLRSSRGVEQGSQNAQNVGGIAEITADSFDVSAFEGVVDLAEGSIPLLDDLRRFFSFGRITRLDPRK